MVEIFDLKDEPEYLETLALWHQGEWSCFNPGESIDDRINRMQPYLNTDFIPSTYIAKETTLLGSAAIIAHDMETNLQLTPWLASVFVAPGERHRGVGSRLVLHIMAQAKNKGITTLYLFTADKQAFYLNLGWTVKSIEQYHGHKVTIMQVILNNH